MQKLDSQVIEKIASINDIERLKSISKDLIVMRRNTTNAYNDMFKKAIGCFFWLSFLAAILSIGSILDVRKSKHSNKSLKYETPQSGAS